jgi:hypothetical protein
MVDDDEHELFMREALLEVWPSNQCNGCMHMSNADNDWSVCELAAAGREGFDKSGSAGGLRLRAQGRGHRTRVQPGQRALQRGWPSICTQR